MDYVVDETGKVAVNILRQENLREEVAQYFGVENTLKQKNVSRNAGASYTQFYTEKSIQVVADWYNSDIDAFGFDFNTAAKKNIHVAV
jgi:2-phospho-L-lactate transferase/gluconeogenesis factor (CofD/UPF0052 family)